MSGYNYFHNTPRGPSLSVISKLLLQTIIRECNPTGMDFQDLFPVLQRTDWNNFWSWISNRGCLWPGACSTSKVRGTRWLTKSEERLRQFTNTWPGFLSVLWFLKWHTLTSCFALWMSLCGTVSQCQQVTSLIITLHSQMPSNEQAPFFIASCTVCHYKNSSELALGQPPPKKL